MCQYEEVTSIHWMDENPLGIAPELGVQNFCPLKCSDAFSMFFNEICNHAFYR
jgi:hypothetical protein